MKRIKLRLAMILILIVAGLFAVARQHGTWYRRDGYWLALLSWDHFNIGFHGGDNDGHWHFFQVGIHIP